MNEHAKFTDQESNELRQAMHDGGIFLKILENPESNVEVVTADGNGGLKTTKTLDKVVSKKIQELYQNQDIYHAPLFAGYRKVSISWFIAEFC